MGWIRFGDCEIDLDAFVVKREGAVLPMQPKVFDVLRLLVERRGALVTKAELLREVWHDEHVNESAVAWSVSHLRRALGQARGSRQPIETVQSRGYRFTAEVSSGEYAARRSEPPSAPRAAALRPAAFVGREGVMAELRRLVEEAVGGHGGLCVLTGEAGIGKTSCADELAAAAGALGARACYGRCPQEGVAPPLWPLAEALRDALRSRPELAAHARGVLPGFGAEAAASPREQAEGARFFLVEQATRLLRELAAAEPLLLVLDDLHWADATTLGLLAFIAPELKDLPLCVVATLREGELRPGSAGRDSLRRLLRYARTVPLDAFDTAQVAELARSIVDHRPTDALAEAVRRASGGIPLFVREIVRSLVREHGSAAFAELQPDAVHPPALARDLLRERMNRLPATTLSLLRSAAVIGDSFDLSLLLAIAEVEPDHLLERLEPAIAEGHLASDAPHRYRFVHSLFQSVLYDDLPIAERVALHRRLGKLLLERPADDRPLAEVARHFYLSLPAGDHLEVMRHCRAAGDAAQAMYAYEDASRYYGWALDAQIFSGSADPEQRGELLLWLAIAQRLGGRTRDALSTSERVIELGELHGLHDLVVRAARLRRPTIAMSMVPDAVACSALEKVLRQLPDLPSAARVGALSLLTYMPPYSNDLARAKQLSARAVALARELPNREPRIEAMRAQLFALSGPDDIAQALAVSDQLLADEAEVGRGWSSGDALAARFSAHIMAGRIAAADAALEQMAAGVRELQLPEATFFCERLLATRRFLDGHFEEAERRWKVLHAQAVRAGVSYADLFYSAFTVGLALEREGWTALRAPRPSPSPLAALEGTTPSMRASYARAAAETGDFGLARAVLNAIGDPGDIPRDGHYLNALAHLAACVSKLGDRPHCERLLELLEPYAELNTPSPLGFYIGAVAHFVGLLSDALGRGVRASACFERALALNQGMGYRAGVVRTLIALGQLSQKLGHRRVARDHLTRALDDANALGMRAAAGAAEGLLRGV